MKYVDISDLSDSSRKILVRGWDLDWYEVKRGNFCCGEGGGTVKRAYGFFYYCLIVGVGRVLISGRVILELG